MRYVDDRGSDGIAKSRGISIATGSEHCRCIAGTVQVSKNNRKQVSKPVKVTVECVCMLCARIVARKNRNVCIVCGINKLQSVRHGVIPRVGKVNCRVGSDRRRCCSSTRPIVNRSMSAHVKSERIDQEKGHVLVVAQGFDATISSQAGDRAVENRRKCSQRAKRWGGLGV